MLAPGLQSRCVKRRSVSVRASRRPSPRSVAAAASHSRDEDEGSTLKTRKPENPPGFPPFFPSFFAQIPSVMSSLKRGKSRAAAAACINKWAALPECHTYSIWWLGKEAPNHLMQLGRSEALFARCARRKAWRKMGNVTARRGALDENDVTRVSHSRGWRAAYSLTQPWRIKRG
jgi:hypothetical protein